MFPITEKDRQKDNLAKGLDYQKYLTDRLRLSAEHKIKKILEEKTHAVDFIADAFLTSTLIGSEADHHFSFEELYVLKELGLTDELNTLKKGEQKHVKTNEIDAIINRYSNFGFSLILFAVNNLANKQQILTEQLKQGSLFKLFSQLSESHKPGTISKSVENSFKISDNYLLNALYFSRFNLLPSGYSHEYPAEEQSLEKWAKKTLLQSCRNFAVYNDRGEIEKINFTLANGVVLSLLPMSESIVNDDNLLEANWQLAISSLLEPNMLEVANQSSQSKCEAFINRPTGQALIAALEFAKLRFSKEFELFLTEGKLQGFSDRFGGPYTHLSRLLAKILWSGDMTKIRKIFVNKNNEIPNEAELKLLAQYPNQDNGLCAFQTILMQLIDKTIDDQTSDIAATSEAIGVSDGACFDVASYYCQALNYGNLYQKTINNKQFLIKTHGSHTLINLTPIWFNGIELPKGSLFTTVDNDEFAFLRLTPFVFNNREDMVSAFGTEIIKAEDNGENVMSVVNYLDRILI